MASRFSSSGTMKYDAQMFCPAVDALAVAYQWGLAQVEYCPRRRESSRRRAQRAMSSRLGEEVRAMRRHRDQAGMEQR
jgi:hypothetical protein